MRGEILLREFRAGDEADLHAVHTECLLANLSGHYTPEQIEAWLRGRTPEGYRRALDGGEHFAVALERTGVVGFASRSGEELLALFVRPAAQGQGVGSALLARCDGEEALTHLKAALNAVSSYERHGFVAVARGCDPKHGVGVPHALMRRPRAL